MRTVHRFIFGAFARSLANVNVSNRMMASAAANGNGTHNADLIEQDGELYKLMHSEKKRQRESLMLIASENFASRPVLQALATCTSNKYSEGLPGARYYGGNEFIDEIERLCQKRALDAFKLNESEWAVNVQPLSGVPANMAVYTALVGMHGRIMGLDLPDGGHLSHGYQSAAKKVSATSLFFESMPYKLDPATGIVDYDGLRKAALLFRPKMIVAGFSCYTHTLDFARFRAIADEVGAYLLADIAHIAGLVAGGASASPFAYCDVVTTTTHKTLRGPRGALIYMRRVPPASATGAPAKTTQPYDLERKINDAVFPGLQGGPHNNNIAAIACALREACEPAFADYARNVVANAKHLSRSLEKRGYRVYGGGTENHIVLWDVRETGLDGGILETALEHANIAVNKNAIPGDKNMFRPSGIRLGSPALTSRNFDEAAFDRVADYIDKVTKCVAETRTAFLAAAGATEKPSFTLKEFKALLADQQSPVGAKLREGLAAIRDDVARFVSPFPLPGLDDL